MLQRISEKLIFRNKPNLLFLLRLILQTDSFFITVSKSMIFENMEMKSGVSTRSISRLEQGASVQLESLIRILLALDLGDHIDLLIPDQTKRPSDYLMKNEKNRQRVKKGSSKKESFKWGDEK